MQNINKYSMIACVVVAVFSLLSLVADTSAGSHAAWTVNLYTPSFALGKMGYAAGLLLSVVSLFLLRYNEKRNSRDVAETVALLSIPLFLFLVGTESYQQSDIVLIATALITFAATFVMVYSSLQTLGLPFKKIALTFIVIAAISIFFQALYLKPSIEAARYSPPVLTNNWWTALNWMKDNTQNCSVIATYWDPGHFIRGIAYRAVVFDGATQGAIRTVPAPGHPDGLEIVPYDNGIKHITVYKDGNATTSRINDIAISLMTSNETLAIDLLRNYRKEGCDMYYIASSDLIGKSVWWSYFSTWDPTTSKGTQLSYQLVNFGYKRAIIGQDATAYYYPISQSQAFVIIDSNNTLTPFYQEGQTPPIPFEGLIYYTQDGQIRYRNPNAEAKGALWLQPDRQLVAYIPTQLQDSMFTKMFLFNGAGLTKFQFINSWGGELKLFKVNFD